jgi:hypothetical protein
VFFKLPGISNIDLGSRTEGIYICKLAATSELTLLVGFVTNRRLLLSSSGMFYPIDVLSN